MQNIYACKNSLLIKCCLVSWHQVAFSSRIIIHAIEKREAEADPITGIHCNMLQRAISHHVHQGLSFLLQSPFQGSHSSLTGGGTSWGRLRPLFFLFYPLFCRFCCFSSVGVGDRLNLFYRTS